MIAGVVNLDLKKYNGKMVSDMAKAENKAELEALLTSFWQIRRRPGLCTSLASEGTLCMDSSAMDIDRS